MFPLVRAVNVSVGGVVPQNYVILIVGLPVSERTLDRRTWDSNWSVFVRENFGKENMIFRFWLWLVPMNVSTCQSSKCLLVELFLLTGYTWSQQYTDSGSVCVRENLRWENTKFWLWLVPMLSTGTGNVLKVQHLLHICSEHDDSKDQVSLGRSSSL